MMWYKKRTDAEAKYVAKQCGLEVEFNAVGPMLHENDLEMLRQQLFKVSQSTMDCLFERTDLSD